MHTIAPKDCSAEFLPDGCIANSISVCGAVLPALCGRTKMVSLALEAGIRALDKSAAATAQHKDQNAEYKAPATSDTAAQKVWLSRKISSIGPVVPICSPRYLVIIGTILHLRPNLFWVDTASDYYTKDLVPRATADMNIREVKKTGDTLAHRARFLSSKVDRRIRLQSAPTAMS